MKKFYGVMTEIYDDGSCKAFSLYGDYEKKPADTLEQGQGATVYKDWYESERTATLALAKRNETLTLVA